VGEGPSSLYRLILAPAGAAVDPAKANLDEKLTNVFVRSPQPRGDVLFVSPTDMWYAYSTNGSHDYHGWRTGYDGSVGYSPTVMSSRRRRLNHFYYSLYGRYNDIQHYRFLDEQNTWAGVEPCLSTAATRSPCWSNTCRAWNIRGICGSAATLGST
jgi:hypothetical protein